MCTKSAVYPCCSRPPVGRLRYRLRAHLNRGGLVAYPTEGSYGLGCLPEHVVGLRRVMQIKKRPQHKGLIVIGRSSEDLYPLLSLEHEEYAEAAALWPAPLTWVFPANARIPVLLRGRRRKTLAVRVPDWKPARLLCAALSTPLVSTSCNRSGRRACRNERDVRRLFGRQVWVIGGKTGGRRMPSAIFRWTDGCKLR